MLCDSYCKVYWVRFVVGFHIYQTYTLSIYHTIYNYEPIHIYIILYMTMKSSTEARISLQFEDHLLCAPCLRMEMARKFGGRMTASNVINRGLAAECQSQCPSLTLQHRQHPIGCLVNKNLHGLKTWTTHLPKLLNYICLSIKHVFQWAGEGCRSWWWWWWTWWGKPRAVCAVLAPRAGHTLCWADSVPPS